MISASPLLHYCEISVFTNNILKASQVLYGSFTNNNWQSKMWTISEWSVTDEEDDISLLASCGLSERLKFIPRVLRVYNVYRILWESFCPLSLFLHLAATQCWAWWGGELVSCRQPDSSWLNVQWIGPIAVQQWLYVPLVSSESLKGWLLFSLFLGLVFYSPPLFLQKTCPDNLSARGNCGYRVLAPSIPVPTYNDLPISALILIFFLAVSQKERVLLL